MKKIDKLINIISLILLFLLIFLGINSIYSQQKIFDEYLIQLESDIKKEYKVRLKNIVDTAISFIKTSEMEIEEEYFKILTKEALRLEKITDTVHLMDNYNDDLIVLSKKSTKNRLSQRIIIEGETFFLSIPNSKIAKKLENKTRRFLYQNTKDNSYYMWISEILDYEGGDSYAKRLIHPNLKDTEGMLLSTNTKDLGGNFPYLEELDGINKNQDVYFEYYFKMLNSSMISKKISYSKLYLNENWIISTGISLDNLNIDMQQRSKILKEKYNDYIFRLGVLGVLCILFCIFLFRFMYNKIHKFFDANKSLRQKLKDELLKSESKVNNYFNLSKNLNIIVDKDSIIIEANETFCETLGYSKEEVLYTSCLDYVHENDFEATAKAAEKFLQESTLPYLVNRYRHKDGTYRYIGWSTSFDNKKEFIYGSGQDITEEKTKGTLLNQQSKMAAMGEMIANIAHQWKQPLSAITSISSSVHIKYENNMLTKDEIPTSMENIEASAKYLAHTIDDFRDFFKEDKEQNLCKIKRTIEKTLKLTSTLYKKNQIEIIQEIEEIEFMVFENELIQVLINLLNNAKDAFTEKNTKRLIFITAYETKDDNVIIEVKDNAGGIQLDVFNKIFDAYFTTKDDNKGTGIGLYMSKEIITKNLNGQITVTNKTFDYDDLTYVGAEFAIKIPYKKI